MRRGGRENACKVWAPARPAALTSVWDQEFVQPRKASSSSGSRPTRPATNKTPNCPSVNDIRYVLLKCLNARLVFYLAEEKSKMRNRGKRGGRRVGCIVCGRLTVPSLPLLLCCVLDQTFAWVAGTNPARGSSFFLLLIAQAQTCCLLPHVGPRPFILVRHLVNLLAFAMFTSWSLSSPGLFQAEGFFKSAISVLGVWSVLQPCGGGGSGESSGASVRYCIHFTMWSFQSFANLNVHCFCLLLTCCMLWSWFVFCLVCVCVCLFWSCVFVSWVFYPFFFMRLITMILFLASACLSVHLGRSFEASPSWHVTLVTRWTSAPSTSARGRCSWANWTRTARDCGMTTTTRTRWGEPAAALLTQQTCLI